MHTKDVAHAGETALRLNLVAVWREATVFTAAERAALELTEQGTRIADAGPVGLNYWVQGSLASYLGDPGTPYAFDQMRAPVTADRLDSFVEPSLCVARLSTR